MHQPKRHIQHNQNYILNGRRIITNKAETQETAGMHARGVAILIHEELEQHSAHMRRFNRGIMKIALRREESHTHTHLSPSSTDTHPPPRKKLEQGTLGTSTTGDSRNAGKNT